MTWGSFAVHFCAGFPQNRLRHSGSPARYIAYRLLRLARVSAAIAPRLPQPQYLSRSFIPYSTNSKRIAKLINQPRRTIHWLSSYPMPCLLFFQTRRLAKQSSSKFSQGTIFTWPPPKSWAHHTVQTRTCAVIVSPT
ncbi:hypothetical protein PILCRDRAFT_742209 [Piloderma croceum F 1598]|uniref:Uncharacterized protein n=1 Tax=Piloderma croceum (strain F 1598) TaxID=765440 RepID=A0A0C3B4W7_PILCF|nr:hypothetical protein PILCRDRAFT_742209 [Piloderma croceum F 1598]